MNRVAALLIIAIAIVAVTAVHDGGFSNDVQAPMGAAAPSVYDDSLGGVELVSITVDGTTYRAVPIDSEFIGWFQSSELLSTDETLTRADFGGIMAVFGESAYRTVSYEWNVPCFDSEGNLSDITIGYVFTATLSVAEYISSINSTDGRHATNAEPMPTHRLSDDAIMGDIVAHLAPIVDGLSDLQRAHVVNAFVQDTIEYVSDREQYGEIEFWATPFETIYSGKGDCEDTAALFVNIAIRLGLNAGFVAFEDIRMGHMSAAVEVPEDFVGTTFVSEGRTYAYVETAVDGHDIPIGVLSGYEIENGKWTLVDHTVAGYSDDGTVPIGVTITDYPVTTYGRHW